MAKPRNFPGTTAFRIAVAVVALLVSVRGSAQFYIQPEPLVQTANVGDLVTFAIAYSSQYPYHFGAYDVAFDPSILMPVAYDLFGENYPAFIPAPEKIDGRLIFLSVLSLNGIENGPIGTVTFRLLRPGIATIRLEPTASDQGQWSDGGPGGSPQPEYRSALLASTGSEYPFLQRVEDTTFELTQLGEENFATVEFVNAGTGPLQMSHSELIPFASFYISDGFTIVDDRCAGQQVAPNAACSVTVAYSPPELNFRRQARIKLRLVSDDLLIPELDTELIAPIASPEMEFLWTIEMTEARQTPPYQRRSVRVVNSGDWPAAVGRLTLGSYDPVFKLTNENCSNRLIAVGAYCDIEVEFRPYQEGAYEAFLSVYYNNEVFRETGRARGFTPTGLPSIDYNGPQEFTIPLGEEEIRIITVTNKGSVPMYMSPNTQVQSRPGFTVLETNCPTNTIANGEYCFYRVLLKPERIDVHLWNPSQLSDSFYDRFIDLDMTMYGVEPDTPGALGNMTDRAWTEP